MTQQQLQHLYWRAGFGIHPNRLKSFSKNRKQIVEALFVNSKSNTPIQLDLSFMEGVTIKKIKDNPEFAKDIRAKSRKKLMDLNYAWINQLAQPKELLREKMTLFWANHFVCKSNNVVYAQQFNNTVRVHALGDFKMFVKAISKEAAMLKYLNGNQNRKAKPNENFARELMELFTLGEGQYSETDIKESARAFTGYNHDFEGNFNFKSKQHDEGPKTFFGKTGNFSGDDIIDSILENKQCAVFISDKICRHFVNPKPNQKHIDAMAEVFYKDYNIEDLMRFVFLSDWFYDESNIGSKIKSPIEYLVGLTNTVPVTFEKERDLIKIQKLLGQTLLDPPNVAGWKGDKAWIDANTIMVRLKLPSVILNNTVIASGEHDEFKKKFMKKHKGKLPFKTIPNWTTFLENFEAVETKDLQDYMLQGTINKGTADYLKTLSKVSKQEYCVQLMSLPEYQMC
ncbi:DUF1800 domain-containing protein [Winogradskyella thalassocola]|uniref:Uncharacterized conserved protein, DUF1800 family n=1 Tax=Winogradskyella thalassocola TaxID=262004 RepID=A0A1G7XI75_9FLAO|nr:DUF1800 domain-containing protein [Winogradskyella thalassocola]SDG83939.1 Uncharacterized conserved protein, DUF1800 family [Winogradskyella thalassocola]